MISIPLTILAHGEGLSPHLRSRHEVGEILRESQATVVELRASRGTVEFRADSLRLTRLRSRGAD